MLGLLFIYFLGRYFYDLARKYNRHEWGYAILGVFSFYGGLMVTGIIMVVIMEIISPGWVDEVNSSLLDLMLLPFGLLISWGVYKYLEARFSNKLARSDKNALDDILDDEFLS